MYRMGFLHALAPDAGITIAVKKCHYGWQCERQGGGKRRVGTALAACAAVSPAPRQPQGQHAVQRASLRPPPTMFLRCFSGCSGETPIPRKPRVYCITCASVGVEPIIEGKRHKR